MNLSEHLKQEAEESKGNWKNMIITFVLIIWISVAGAYFVSSFQSYMDETTGYDILGYEKMEAYITAKFVVEEKNIFKSKVIPYFKIQSDQGVEIIKLSGKYDEGIEDYIRYDVGAEVVIVLEKRQMKNDNEQIKQKIKLVESIEQADLFIEQKNKENEKEE